MPVGCSPAGGSAGSPPAPLLARKAPGTGFEFGGWEASWKELGKESLHGVEDPVRWKGQWMFYVNKITCWAWNRGWKAICCPGCFPPSALESFTPVVLERAGGVGESPQEVRMALWGSPSSPWPLGGQHRFRGTVDCVLLEEAVRVKPTSRCEVGRGARWGGNSLLRSETWPLQRKKRHCEVRPGQGDSWGSRAEGQDLAPRGWGRSQRSWWRSVPLQRLAVSSLRPGLSSQEESVKKHGAKSLCNRDLKRLRLWRLRLIK